MKQIAVLFIAMCVMSVVAKESNAQSFSYGSWGGGRGVGISIGSGGFYNPGWGGPGYGAFYPPPYYQPMPVYRPYPVYPVYPVYGGWGGGWGGGCRNW
jgi:hypothetical protein